MPIQASLGALSYPRVVGNAPLPANSGFASILSTTTGTGILSYSEGEFNTLGGSVGVDSAGNMYVAGSKPPVVGVTDLGYFFKLDSTDGSGLFDEQYTNLGYGASCSSTDVATFTHTITGPGSGSGTLYSTYAYRLSGNTFTGGTTINAGTPSGGTRAFMGNTRLGGNNACCVAYALESFEYIMGVSISPTGTIVKRGLQGSSGTPARSQDCTTDSNNNFYVLGRQALTSYIAKWNSAGTIQWKIQGATSIGMNSIVADTSFLYVACNDGKILKIDGSTGSIVLQYDFNGGNYITIGSDGYLYTSGNNLSVQKLDTNLNAQWGLQASFGGTASSGGQTAGIVQLGSHIYICGGGTFNGRQALFCVKTLSDGSVPAPGIWWVGSGAYVTIFNTTPVRTSASITLTSSSIATGIAGTTTSIAASGSLTSQGFVLGNIPV
jgi:hypothetical protein